MKQPSQKKRPFFLRVPFLLVVAVGAGVAVLASREDGREKLDQFGEFVGKSAEVVGTMFSNAQRMAADYIEQMQHRDDANYPASSHAPLFQPNGSTQRPSEYSHTH